MITHIFVTNRLPYFMRRDVFQAIADPVRREILALLANDVLSVNAIAQNFEISRPAISKHIKILTECGLIIITSKGRERYCHIQAGSLIPAFMWLDQYRNLWEERIDSFEHYINELQNKTKKDE